MIYLVLHYSINYPDILYYNINLYPSSDISIPQKISNYSLHIFKGTDVNNRTFTAFILLCPGDNVIPKGQSIDLTQYNIIYKTSGHNIDEKTLRDIVKYLKYGYIPKYKSMLGNTQLNAITEDKPGYI